MDFEDFKNRFQKKAVTEYPHQVSDYPVVSICVQTYNQVRYISACLDSILMQRTRFSFEILLGDDNSNDGTREICVTYADRYPEKIKLFLHERENNIKINGNNTGIFNSLYNIYSARGKYIAYCDGDDLWADPNKLQKQVDFLEQEKNYVLAYHQAIFIDANGDEINDSRIPEMSKRDFSSLELKMAVVQPMISTWCFRNKILDIPFEITKTINADNFWISLLGWYGEGKYLEDIGPSHYRIHKAGIWSLINKDKQFASKTTTYRNMSRYYATLGEDELSDFFKKRSKNYSKMLIAHNLKKFRLKKAFYNTLSMIKF